MWGGSIGINDAGEGVMWWYGCGGGGWCDAVVVFCGSVVGGAQ